MDGTGPGALIMRLAARLRSSTAAAVAAVATLVAGGVLPVGGTTDQAAAFPARGPMEAASLTHPDGLNHYAVRFTEGSAPSALPPGTPARGAADPYAAALAAVPGTRSVEAVGGGHYAVAGEAGPDGYAAVPGASVVEDPILSVFGDPYLGWQWSLRNTGATVSGIAGVAGVDVGADDAWAKADGSGVLVAVVDGGMQISHPDLAANIWANPGEVCGNGLDDDANGYVDDCRGWDFANDDASVEDSGVNRYGQTIDNTHATHVAGIIAAVRDNDTGVAGLAPRAAILPVKLSDTNSWATSMSARGIRYAADMGADIINCSFGTTSAVTMEQIPSLVDAVAYATAKGALVVAAAGNAGRDIDALPTYPAALPDPGVVSVGASTNNDQRAYFSNWGATSVDLFAPGWSILSTVPGSYGSMHGTSMAAPLVSAAAALVLDARPGSATLDVKHLLMTGSTPVGAFTGLSASGQRLDAGRILNPAGDPARDEVTFAFDGFAGAPAGTAVEATVEATVEPDSVPAGSGVGYRATLLTAEAGVTYGVSGAEIITEGGTAITGEDAAVDLSPAGGYPTSEASRPLRFGYALPAGDYAVVTEAYSAADHEPIGRPWAVFFSVVPPGQAAPPPATQPPPGPATPPPPGTTITTTPVGGTRPPGGTTTTTRPGGSVPGPGVPAPSPGGPTPTTQTLAPTPTTVPGETGTPAPTTPPPATVPPATTTTTRPPSPAPSPVPTATTTTIRPPAPPPAVPLPPPPDPATDGRLTVSALEPRFGSTAGGDRILVSGAGFAGPMHVLFGNSPGAGVWVISPTALLVTTPGRSSAGTVDVRVSTALDSVVLDDAFTFIAPAPSPGVPTTATTHPPVTDPPLPSVTTTTRPATVTTSPRAATTTTRPAGGTVPTVPPPLVTPTTLGSSTTTTAPAPTPPRRFTFGSVTATRGALLLRPLTGPSPLSAFPPSTWPARRCSADACPGTKL